MTDTAPPKHTNSLVNETSPYLLQHAHNPVDWYPWGPEALEKARSDDRVILLSIGYSACHWCHVMERESFENESIAAVMNQHFVNIKVDREERPDIDDIYMAATLAMNQGQGGWPMTVFLTPDLEPIFAGTYFPPEDTPGRPGFPTLLKHIADAWEQDRDDMKSAAVRFVEQLRERRQEDSTLSVGEEVLRTALQQYGAEFDATFGGFGPAPKFPSATSISLLLGLHRRLGDEHALLMARKTLDAMARGGMYDQIGGGFSRYSTDRQWLVPHFEKMLYDNALLAVVYIEAYQVTGDWFYRRIATEILDYVIREMTAPEGGFYSATDADSEGEEGKFFVWTPEEIGAVIGVEDALIFNAYYDITDSGNWEGKNIPNTPRTVSDVAKQFNRDPDSLQEQLDELRRAVYDARLQRVKPGLDDKIITAWNGMMIRAFATGHRVLGDTRYLDTARRAADFLLTTLSTDDGRLLRAYRSGKAHLNAYLEDHAFLSEALVDLYETSGDARYLRHAERLLEIVVRDFHDPDSGSLFNTGSDHEQLLLRHREGADGATPSGNAVAASALERCAHHLGRDDFRAAAIRGIRAYGSMIARHPRGFAKSLQVVDRLLEGPVELALVGEAGSADLEALRREVARHFLPNSIQSIVHPGRDDGHADLPLTRGKSSVGGRAALYVCHDFVCKAPVTDPSEAADMLENLTGHGSARMISARLEGCATEKGTARYASRLAATGYTAFGTTRLTASLVGFGTYRVTDGISEHREALTRALLAGANLIDTAATYMDGGSERLVGSVLRELIEGGDLSRDEVIVISKIGYVQGRNHALAAQREQDGKAFAEMVKIRDGMWHCIHPEFLEDQFQRSLDRLELDTLDACLLHNPEYFLAMASASGQSLVKARDEFYRRVSAAFEFFESQVAAGRLRWYGVSSNTIVAPATAVDAVAVSRLIDAAQRVAGDEHFFKVLQLPLNLYESGAVFERNNGPGRAQTALDAAGEARLAVLANRPLNASSGRTMLRLADVPVVDADDGWEEQRDRVARLEEEFRNTIAPHVDAPPDGLAPNQYFGWAAQLSTIQSQRPSFEQWAQVEGQMSYTVGRIAASLDETLVNDVAGRWAEWRSRYFGELNKLVHAMRAAAANAARKGSEAVSARIDPLIAPNRRDQTLSRKALWTVASTPGITCVLNGMRTVQYVEDALGIIAWEPAERVEEIYQAFR
ncbi:MAG: DUF255 domain-containing protein [Gemmatimonadetes bacterium]|nr:DUF255 domain-containing protein [Gemmatimonadota bacterium]